MKNNIENKKNKLGAKIIFASADLSAFKKASDDELKAVVSNCSIKISLNKNELPG
jgi:hypothetical protein